MFRRGLVDTLLRLGLSICGRKSSTFSFDEEEEEEEGEGKGEGVGCAWCQRKHGKFVPLPRNVALCAPFPFTVRRLRYP